MKKKISRQGAWGKKNCHFSIVKMGSDVYCLNIKSYPDGGQGYLIGESSFYSIDESLGFSEIFSYTYFDSSIGAKGDIIGREILQTIELVPGHDEYFEIEVNTKNSHSNFIKKNLYKYFYELGSYRQIK